MELTPRRAINTYRDYIAKLKKTNLDAVGIRRSDREAKILVYEKFVENLLAIQEQQELRITSEVRERVAREMRHQNNQEHLKCHGSKSRPYEESRL